MLVAALGSMVAAVVVFFSVVLAVNAWRDRNVITLERGTKLTIAEELTGKVYKREIDCMLGTFANAMTLSPLAGWPMEYHLSQLRIDMVGCPIPDSRGAMLGVTRSKSHIVVSFLERHRSLSNTALLYELRNSLIWRTRGYTLAIAESIADPDDIAIQRWIDDQDGDGDHDAQDVRLAMQERARLDAIFSDAGV